MPRLIFLVATTLAAMLYGMASARADMIAMRDFNLLKRGMSEAEILFRIGPSDHESLYLDYHHNPLRRVWYYIPEQRGSDAWITEIEFDHLGRVQELRRYRAR
jgi:hypothetical protein